MLASGCKLADNKDSFEESFVYSFQTDQQIVVDTTEQPVGDSTETFLDISTEAGDQLVFKFQKTVTPPPTVEDGGSSKTVHFQIPRDADEFSLEDGELNQADVFFERGCFCPFIGALKIEEGFIRGQKLSGNIWTVSASLQTETESESFHVEFDGTFIQE